MEMGMHHGYFLVDRVQKVDAKLKLNVVGLFVDDRVKIIKTIFEEIRNSVLFIDRSDKLGQFKADLNHVRDNVIKGKKTGFQR